MTLLGCGWIRELLAAYYDDELSVSDQIIVRSHLDLCAGCSAEARRLRALGDIVRVAATQHPAAEPDIGFQSSIVIRIGAERDQAVAARLGRMFEDSHLLWAAFGATAAAVICTVLTVALLKLAPERSDSLAGLLSVMSSPGSNENPVRLDSRVSLPVACTPERSHADDSQSAGNR